MFGSRAPGRFRPDVSPALNGTTNQPPPDRQVWRLFYEPLAKCRKCSDFIRPAAERVRSSKPAPVPPSCSPADGFLDFEGGVQRWACIPCNVDPLEKRE